MAKDELRLIEDALIEGILNASPEETIADLRERGMAPDAAEALLDRMAAEAVRSARGKRLAAAKDRAVSFRARAPASSVPHASPTVRDRLQAFKAGVGDPGMMLAARKGGGMSDRDEKSLAEDLAELDRLRSEDGEA